MEHRLLAADPAMTRASQTSQDVDLSQMRSLVAFTRARLGTEGRSPFGSSVVETLTGRLVMRRLNGVRQENDPSSHAEVRALRAACKRLKRTSLAGHTLYTTCEPCPMCMSMALWSGIDRVVFGATIDDASRHCSQIHVPAEEIASRSDMDCVVTGPVARAECVALFEDPRMAAAMALWRRSRPKRTASDVRGRPAR
jgi:tRNA(adenine34) deaminase